MHANDATEVVPYLTSAALIMYAQRWLKTRDAYVEIVRALPMADRWIHRGVAALGALIAAVGIHVTFSGDPTTGWTFSGSIPNVWELLHGLCDFVKVYALQQLTYDATKHPTGHAS